ncbi:TlpA family protein disulfide reductase [Leptospira langatensis]|uniref:TlpA family protein disulfide reductase n=1 Tax=Leptospira langatensis TaxID=2484983 RepID=A0A5F1ZWV2_9LEPT|nr:thioredoxin-like domain-containing protein [Leptospira langatensis]TGK01483.1 TlpA family protein disulfide reductase [Leptospira langatensis]TGL42067.1 TlpA family protein disulfide reductase [Leptospira langatensis]
MKTFAQILICIVLSVNVFAEDKDLKLIPNIPLYTLDMERKTLYQELENLKEGDLVIINFTSSNCPPCKEEVPNLLQYSKKWNLSNPKNRLHLWIVFLGDDAISASEFAKSLGVQKPTSVYFDSFQTSMRILDFPGTPTTFVLRKKEILFKEFGYTEANWSKMISVLENRK